MPLCPSGNGTLSRIAVAGALAVGCEQRATGDDAGVQESASAVSSLVQSASVPASSASAAASAVSPSTSPSIAVSASSLEPGCRDLVAAGADDVDKQLGPPGARAITLSGLRPGTHLHGVHVSTPAPWKTLAEGGFAYAFAAAAYGATANKHFADNWGMMKRCGFLRGAYHFVVPGRDGGYQARVLLEQMRGDIGDVPPTIDLERPVECNTSCCDQPCERWIAVTDAWLRAVGDATGKRAMIYTVEPFWNECMCGTPRFAKHPLWLGAWPKFDFPKRPGFGGFTEWIFYHYIGNRRIAGGVIDIDMFQGNMADLHRWIELRAGNAK